MSNIQTLLKKNSPLILTAAAAVGMVYTTVSAVKATPKAMELIKNAEEEKGEELTNIEKVKVAWKPYIPSLLSGSLTLASMFGAYIMSSKQQASLASAYVMLSKAYEEYKLKSVEIYGNNAKNNIYGEIIKARYDDSLVLDDDELLFFDVNSLRFYKSTMNAVIVAENAFLKSLADRRYASLNEYYDLVGLPHVDYGYQLGWMELENNDPYNCKGLEFDYERFVRDDGTECWFVTTNIPPALDFIF